MISNILELQKFASEGAKQFDDHTFRERHIINSPGCSDSEIKALQEYIPSLAKSYLEVIKKYDMNGIELGYFTLSPSSAKRESLVDKLIQINEDPFFPQEFMKRHKMYQIGSNNTDLVCVTSGTDNFLKGEILYIVEGQDIYNPEDDQIYRLAKDFEQFLIIAANLNQLHQQIAEDESNFEEKKAEFIKRLKTLGVSEEYHKAWKSLF